MKSYTDLEQSKKLAEILPFESADMYYMETSCNNYTIGVLQRLERNMLLNQAEYYRMLPCWSLAALISALPNDTSLLYFDDSYQMVYDKKPYVISNKFDNPVDACVEMVIKLHELKML